MARTRRKQDLLIEEVRNLIEAGFQLAPVGDGKRLALAKGEYEKTSPRDLTTKTLSMVERGAVQGFRIELGVRGAIPQPDGTVLVPLAIEHEGHVSQAYKDRFADAVARLGAQSTWERLDSDDGFIQETGGGGFRWFFLLPLASTDDLTDALARVQSRVAKESGETAAELLTQHAIAAPSYGNTHPSGTEYRFESECDPSTMPTVTVDELAILGAVLADTSDADPVTAEGTIVKLPGRLSSRARDVMHLHNAGATDATACELLLDAGWTVRSGEVGFDDEVFFTRPDAKTGGVDAKVGGGEREGGVYVYTTSDELLPQGYHHPFALYARLVHDADASAAAEALLSDGTVEIPATATSVLRAKKVRELELHTMSSVDAQQHIVDALASAENPRDSSTPFALVKADAVGAPQILLTPVPGAQPTRWTSARDLGALLLAVVQPCSKKYGDDGEVTSVSYKHAVDGKLVEGVYKHLLTTPNALPSVRTVASEPVLVGTRDGLVIVSEPGYHPETSVLLTVAHADRSFWSAGYRVDATPSQAQAQAAADYLLDEVLADFPFATDGDRARALAYLLTLTARSALPTVPAWLFDAPDRGSGKSKLGDACRLVAFGSTETTAVFPSLRDDEENRKSVVGAVQTGKTNLHIDEMPRGAEITSKALTEIVTAQPGTLSYRVLGGNQMLSIEGLTLTYAGNNVAVGGDFNRRTFPIRLEWTGSVAAHERGGFRHTDLLQWVRDNRPALLAAAHTVLLYGSQHRVPTPSVGSFERWSELVLGALAHVDLGGRAMSDLVMDGRSAWTEANDAIGEEWTPFYAWWHENIRGATDVKGLRNALDTAHRQQIAVELPADLYANPGEGDQAVNRRWAFALKAMRGTAVPHDGVIYRLTIIDRGKKAFHYRLDVTEHTRETQTTAVTPRRAVSTSAFMPEAAPQRSRHRTSPSDEIVDLEFA